MQSVRAYCLLAPPVPRPQLRFLSRRAEEPARWRRPRGPPPRGAASASAARSARLPAGRAAAGPGAPPHEAVLPPGAGAGAWAGAARPASPSQIRSSRCRFTLCRSMSRAGPGRAAQRRGGTAEERGAARRRLPRQSGRAGPRPRGPAAVEASQPQRRSLPLPLPAAAAAAPRPAAGRPTTLRGAAASEGPRPPAARERAAGPSAPPAPPRPAPPGSRPALPGASSLAGESVSRNRRVGSFGQAAPRYWTEGLV